MRLNLFTKEEILKELDIINKEVSSQELVKIYNSKMRVKIVFDGLHFSKII